MGNPQVVEALYRAYLDRATGWLTCTAHGRETRIPFREGSVVGTSLGSGFGWQGTVPALVQRGRLGLAQLDALWARGEASAVDSDTLDELGVVPAEAESARVLASIRETVRIAEAVRFEQGEVGSGDLVSGARVVREAWATLTSAANEPAWFRITDLQAAARWEPSEEDRRWLEEFSEWKQPRGADIHQLALLEVLTRSGVLDSVPAEEMRRRESDRRRQEEEARAKIEEQERLEEEARLKAEADERARLAREEAERLAEEARRVEEERQARLEEEARLRRAQEEQLEAEEQVRLAAEEKARLEAEELARLEAEEEAARLAEEEQARVEAGEKARLAAEEHARSEAERLAEEERARLARIEEERLAEEERARLAAEEQERLAAEEKARLDEEERARLAAEEQARLEAEAQARLEAEDQARLAAEEQARLAAEERARLTAEEQARLAAEEERLAAEELTRLAAEKQARLAAEEQARLAAEEQARLAAEEQARLAAEEQARLAAEEQARVAAEEARLAAEEQARLAAEEAARLAAEEAARLAEKERLDGEEQARLAAEEERLAAEEQDRFAEQERIRLAAEEHARLVAEEKRLAAEEQARFEVEEHERARLAAEEQARLAAEAEEQERVQKSLREADERAAADLARIDAVEAARTRAAEEAAAQRLALEGEADRERLESEIRRRAAEADEAVEDEERQVREDQLRSSENARARAEDELRLRAEEETRRRAEEARFRAEEESRLREEEETRRRDEEEEEALLVAAQAARVRVEAERAQAAPPPAKPDQQSLLDRMNAALRQATYVGPAPAAPPPPRREEKTDPHILAPVQLKDPAPSAPPRRPLMLGGEGQEEVDLWSLVQPASATAPAPGGVQSFEEALRRVDSSLEALVGPGPSQNEQMVEPILEAEVVSVSPEAAMTSRMEGLEGNADMDSAEAARLRRQRLLKRAMENLGSLPQRPPESSASGITSSGSGILMAPSNAAPASSATPAPSAAEQQLAGQIEARFSQTSRKDFFLTLGLVPTASKEQVKAAFLNLAKIFHPDRLPPSLPHLSQKMSAVFEGIREAYETLHDDAKRAAWVAGQQSSKQAPAAQASDLFKMGEVYFKKRDYKQADAHFAKAHALDKSANSLAAQAWSIYMDPTRKAEGAAARQMMQKALTIDASSDRAHYQLGVIGRVEGDMDRAERHFREAVRANPKHLEANQELRLIEMRKKKASDPKKGGGGFFG